MTHGTLDAQVSFTKTLETSREELTTGAMLAGRYQIIEELGRGGILIPADKKLADISKRGYGEVPCPASQTGIIHIIICFGLFVNHR